MRIHQAGGYETSARIDDSMRRRLVSRFADRLDETILNRQPSPPQIVTREGHQQVGMSDEKVAAWMRRVMHGFIFRIDAVAQRFWQFSRPYPIHRRLG
jgi:hypothetical protein